MAAISQTTFSIAFSWMKIYKQAIIWTNDGKISAK